MPNRLNIGTLALTLAVLTACGERTAAKDTTRVNSAATPAAQTAPAAASTESGRMIEQVTVELRALDGASADSLRRALPTHRQLVANLIAEMNREMRDMHMQADASWTATVDSLRQDLTRMPDLGSGELAAMMPAHRARLERLMQAHRTMMRGM